jgi:hypothetical protein
MLRPNIPIGNSDSSYSDLRTIRYLYTEPRVGWCVGLEGLGTVPYMTYSMLLKLPRMQIGRYCHWETPLQYRTVLQTGIGISRYNTVPKHQDAKIERESISGISTET